MTNLSVKVGDKRPHSFSQSFGKSFAETRVQKNWGRQKLRNLERKEKLSSDRPVLDNSVDNFYVSIIQGTKKYSAVMYWGILVRLVMHLFWGEKYKDL